MTIAVVWDVIPCSFIDDKVSEEGAASRIEDILIKFKFQLSSM
jgi:hypothetical protein